MPRTLSERNWITVACFAAWIAGAFAASKVGIWIGVGGTAIVLGLVVVTISRETRILLRPSAQLLLLGFVGGALLSAITYLLYPLLVWIAPESAHDAARLYAVLRKTPPLLAALLLPAIVIGEEVVWRGVVQGAFTQRLGPKIGVAAAAVAYALAHLPLASPLLVLAALACAIPWGLMRIWTGSLVPTVLAHLIWDALVMFFLPLAGSPPSH